MHEEDDRTTGQPASSSMCGKNAMAEITSRHVHRNRRWAVRCLAVYWVVMLVAMHFPLSFPRSFPATGWDKVLHFIAYSVLTGLLGWWMFAGHDMSADFNVKRVYRRAALMVALVTVYGLIDEATQPLTNREFDWWDWAADTAAAVLTGGVVTLVVLRRARGAMGGIDSAAG